MIPETHSRLAMMTDCLHQERTQRELQRDINKTYITVEGQNQQQKQERPQQQRIKDEPQDHHMPRFPELLQSQTPAIEVEERSQQLQDVQRTSRIKQETRSQEAEAGDQQHLARNLLNRAVEIEAQAASLAVKVKFQNKQRCVEDLSALDWTLHSAEYLEMLG
jgi:hypothetical protein